MILIVEVTYGQAPPSITSSGLNTQVSGPVALPNGAVQHNITGGTRPGGGANLFHSFGEFGVPTNNIANFLNDAALLTTNILSRVTGGNPSNILGTIQTEGFGNANLFLMNPAGIVFGPNVSLNVGGSTHFTTADYLRLADGVQFTALPGAQDALLSIAPVAAFGFLGPNPGGISVDGSTFSFKEGQSLSLIGGDITIGGSLNAPEGKIAVASVASRGEVLADTYASAPNINGQSFTTMGNISLLEGTTLNVSGDAAGTVVIRGGELMITDARIAADTVDNHSAPVAVDIELSGDLTIIDTQSNSAITSRTTGSGDAGEVRISANNMNAASNSSDLFFSLIDTHTSGSGTAGNVNITAAGTVHSMGDHAGAMFVIDSGTSGVDGGHGGDVTITAQQLKLTDAGINTGDLIARSKGETSTGSGGNLTITADSVQVTSSRLVSDGFNAGKAGDISITAQDIQLNANTIISASELGGGGRISISANSLFMDFAGFEVETVDGIGAGMPWEGVTITATNVELRNGSLIKSQTFGDGAAGNIRITATERLILADDPTTSGTLTNPSGLLTNSFGDEGDQGPAGAIFIETGQLEMSGGARIDSTTQSSGRGGDVTITVTNGISLAGARPEFPFEESTSVLGSTRPSGIFSRTVGSEFCTGPCGDAGNILIRTGSLTVNDGAAINSGTTSTGKGGTITVNAAHDISVSGMIDDGTPGGFFSRTTGSELGAGEGGIINLTAGDSFFLKDGATVSASSSGPGQAGSIAIDVTAGSFAIAQGAFVNSGTTSTGAGGAVSIHASDNIAIAGTSTDGKASGVLSRTTGTDSGAGAGGTISLTAGQNFTLSDRATVSASSDGPGNASDIAITAGALTIAQGAVVDSGTTSTGAGGAISLIAGQNFTFSDGARVSARSEGPGTAGAIDIDVTGGSFAIAQGAVVDSGTTSTGAGGAISVHASGNISITGILDGTPSGVLSQTTGAGAGGTIALTAGQNFTLSDGATVSASSDGPGNAGNVDITAQDTILIQKASVTAEALQASGGNIKLKANDTIKLVDSTIASSVEGDVDTQGGNISLDPDFIILQNSQILAKAGAGKGGNISLIANDVVLVDSFSVLDATAATGISGTVTIESPIQNLSGTIVPLPQNPVPVTALYGSRCVAGAGGHFSTFVDSKADSLAPTPGTFLASPFLPLSNLSKSGELGDAGMPTGGSGTSQAPHLQVAVYSPPVLFGYDDGILSACP